MPTQHRPGREPRRDAKDDLTLFHQALQDGNVKRAEALLRGLDRAPPPGLWQHRSLALALNLPRETSARMVQRLLDSRHPPKPTPDSDFIKLAVQQRDPDALELLLTAGFEPTPGTTSLLLTWVAQTRGWTPQGLRVEHVRAASGNGWQKPAQRVLHACAEAILNGADERWMDLLSASVDRPVPMEPLAQMFLTLGASAPPETDEAWATTGWNRAQARGLVSLEAAQAAAEAMLGAPRKYTVRQLDHVRRTMARLEGNALLQSTGEATVGPASARPRSRL